MGGSSKKVTVGYRYFLGIHMILCHGPIDRLRKILVDGKTAWQGSFSGGRLTVSATNLFGGESREGGVSGEVDIEMGRPTQGVNSYLASQLGSDIPAFRGVAGAVLRQCYLGINPYLKKWAFLAQRIHTRQDGIPQWLDAKAEISQPDKVIVSTTSGGWEYVQLPEQADPGFSALEPPSSGWAAGTAPFGSGGWTWPGQPARNTNWDMGTVLWMRRNISVPSGSIIVARVRAENGCVLFLNGTYLGAANRENVQLVSGEVFDFTLPPGDHQLTIKAFDEVPTLGDVYISVEILSLALADMNPAHIIRECLTDPDWGMGYQESDIDSSSFTTAANTLHAETFGLSLIWDRQTPIEDFVKEVVRHIQASLYVDRVSGKFVLKLIRDDYNFEDLLVLDESNIEKVENFSRPSFGDMVNSVTINYWDQNTYKTASVSAQDTALIQMQGSVIGTTIQYPGCTSKSLAARLATRDLHILSTPLRSCTVYANREAASLNVGHPFVLNWPDYMEEPTVMRVIGLALGDGRSNKVKITCTEDAFYFPETAIVAPEDPEWSDPSTSPSAALYRVLVEAPYYELVQRLGQTSADSQLSDNPNIGYLLASALAPSGAINARLAVNSGAGYDGNDTPMDFCPGGFLSADVRQTDTVFVLSSHQSLDSVVVGSHAQVGSELVKVVSAVGSSVTVGRGVLDTVPAAHPAGTAVLFWDAFADSDGVEYVFGESVSAKMLTVTGSGELSLSDAPTDNLSFTKRAVRPYPPGKLLLNSVAYPVALLGSSALTVSWAHRDRLQQTAGELQDTTVGDIGPEAGTTYNLRLYGEAGTLLRSVSLSGTSYSYAAADERSDSLIPDGGNFDPLWGNVVFGMHMDGADNGTSFPEVRGKTVTRSGSVVTKTGIKKFGSASAYFDGNNDYLSVASHADFGFGTGDFTIEMQVYKAGNTVTGSGSGILLDMRTAEPSVAIELHIRPSGAGTDPNKLEVYINGATRIISSTAFGTSFKHVTLERKSGVTKLFVEGAQEGSSYTDANDYGASAPLILGGRFAAVSGDFRSHNGYIDEVRITKGVARYDGSNFTPPSVEFPESATGTYRLNGRLLVELESERGGLVSHQAHNYTVLRAGYGFNYGELYGGV